MRLLLLLCPLVVYVGACALFKQTRQEDQVFPAGTTFMMKNRDEHVLRAPANGKEAYDFLRGLTGKTKLEFRWWPYGYELFEISEGQLWPRKLFEHGLWVLEFEQ